jgi:hypothetical protein
MWRGVLVSVGACVGEERTGTRGGSAHGCAQVGLQTRDCGVSSRMRWFRG